ncbi:Glycosyltransferase, GT2 family [Methylobacterium sp. 174MFSha1.1]|uniref:glycosyltransferase n=1 Tax=Methylobacterium sp. 174MFSha1.1 TaxID=1502749 RepID=UPI0008F12379|nr:glycosyltransferase [Methylobacterium sp. 174MFSha1.1]SFV17639.1 Glycosyltransferase, GT2 family [Methylobacterium sp. 174MFSha1.1]
MAIDKSNRPHVSKDGFVWNSDGFLIGNIVDADIETTVSIKIDSITAEKVNVETGGLLKVKIPNKVFDGKSHEISFEPLDGEPLQLNLIVDPSLRNLSRSDLRPIRPNGVQLAYGENLLSLKADNNMELLDKNLQKSSLDMPAGNISDYNLTRVVEALHVQTEALHALLQKTSHAPLYQDQSSQEVGRTPAIASTLNKRYGDLLEEVIYRTNGHDVIWLGVIDWNFRIQRPQHLAAGLAQLGCRVLYISIVFKEADEKGLFEIIGSPAMGVFEVRLKLNGVIPPNIYGGFSDEQVNAILAALDELGQIVGLRSPVVVVQYPSWYPVAAGIQGATVVHDCLDLVSGFDNVPSEMVKLEEKLVRNSDIVVTTSAPLQEHVAPIRSSVIIRNGADVDFFSKAYEVEHSVTSASPVIGYFGAIAHWFEVDWILEAAIAEPDWNFVLIGSTDGADVEKIRALPNVQLLGERPYSELPSHLANFDIAIIPFKLIDLIICTNPVKLYEYMAGGKAVVASAMPEVVAATDLVYIAKDAKDFISKIQIALEEDNKELRAKRVSWAQNHSWISRSQEFVNMLSVSEPKVSIIVLSYNNWIYTSATLWSILSHSNYRNLEIIVVDNGSKDSSPRNLNLFAARDNRIEVILSDDNLGYAGGNNLGLRAATGEYIILLNNDVYVTDGWVRDLVRPLLLDSSIGLVSPITNNIGNEQKVKINYSNMSEMALEARKVVRRHKRSRFETDSVAFFCAAIRREVVEEVGLLDESYGQGFFEDDDYCMRVRQAGYRIQIVDDVFIHHHLSASFDALGSDRKHALMEVNKAIFEEKWGKWKPHHYREAPDFG